MKYINLEIRERAIYLIVFFLVYGFYASGTNLYSNNSITFFLLPIIILPIIFFISGNDIILDFKKINLSLITKENFLILLTFFVFFTFFSWEKLNLSISDDEFAYIKIGIFHSLQLNKNFLYRLSLLDNFSLKFAIQILNILIVFFIFLFTLLILFLTNKSKNYALLFCLFSLIFFRLVIYKFGGNVDPHPPLIALPTLLFSSLFGLSDFVIKLSYIFIYTLFGFYLFLKFKFVTSKFLSFFIVLFALSIPGIIYLGSTVEQALWTVICFSIIMFETQDVKKINYKKIFLIIAFFSFFRILCLLSLILVFFSFCKQNKSLIFLKKNLSSIILNSYPLLLIAPFIFYAIFDHSNMNIDSIQIYSVNFYDFFKNTHYYILDNFNIISGSLIILIFIIGLLHGNFIFLLFSILISLIYAGQYHDSLNNFIYSPKYVYEIYFPTFLISIFIILKKTNKNTTKILIILLLFISFLYNFYFIKNYTNICLLENPQSERKHIYKVKFGCDLHISHPINFKNAFTFLKNQEDFNFGNLYVPGVYYGILPSILNGMTFKFLNNHINIIKDQNSLNLKANIIWFSADAKNIQSNTKIEYVLLSDLINRKEIINGLLKLDWTIIYTDISKKHKTKNIILKRK